MTVGTATTLSRGRFNLRAQLTARRSPNNPRCEREIHLEMISTIGLPTTLALSVALSSASAWQERRISTSELPAATAWSASAICRSIAHDEQTTHGVRRRFADRRGGVVFTVSPAPLTAADDKERVVGHHQSSLTAGYAGFVNAGHDR